jgi:hypothetical protein
MATWVGEQRPDKATQYIFKTEKDRDAAISLCFTTRLLYIIDLV